jgi:imidazolonepropionase-like amidohydrolase
MIQIELTPSRRSCWALLFLFSLAAPAVADEPTTRPVEGLRKHEPAVYALVEARIVVSPGKVIEKGTVVIRDRAIVAVGADVSTPADAQIVRLTGRTIYPGLIDAFSEISVPAPASISGYWNPKIVPEIEAAAAYRPDAAVNKTLRSQGITARLVAPEAGLIKGTSALVTSGDEPGRRSLLKTPVALHAKLSMPRVRRLERPTEYPASPMGALALVRQVFYDAQWHRDARRAWQADTRLARPESNDALDALARYAQRRLPVIVDASDELYFLRADRAGRELGLNIVVRGSGNEYRRLDAIAATGRAVIVPVNFPKAPDVASPEAALEVSLERMMHWDLAPENPARLDRAGVRIAITSAGLAEKSKFLAAVRRAVHRGLSSESALRALTTTPAELFGVANRIGTIDVAKMANFVVTDGDLFAEKTKVLETWVDGRRYEAADAPLHDVRGGWELLFRTGEAPPATVKMELSGQPLLKGKIQAGDRQGDIRKAAFSDDQLTVSFGGEILGKEGVARLSVTVTVDERGNATCSGSGVWPDGTAFGVTGRRVERAKQADEDSDGDDSDNAKKKPKPPEPKAALFAVNFPLGEFGREASPAKPAAILFKDATVWTCGPAGVVEHGSVLVKSGRIAAVGAQIEVPPGAIVVDCQGKHLTPGIIDCHSHIATDGGINEATQAITAEVRIGDFVDPRDINIYRQLAGGVTSSNILHGSANPIGGQNQVLKFRWGALPEAMKFADAPPGIKFALGENVKQSNWGDRFTTRYPQTRMGVEQIMRDAFLRARSYRRQATAWQREKTGLPPRVDLELEALAEVVEGKRWVHCHSYRQDEILMLMRLCEEFGIKIGTFQHILEGYKVADVMARHGAMGSSFSDWWAYKFEVFDAIPYNGALLFAAGVNVSFNSDDAELGRRLNLEAAKAVKYGRVPPAEALKFVTLNPARQLRIDARVGSLEAGKDADLVIWSGPPLSVYTRCEQTWIDGQKFFDRQEDAQARERHQRMRTALVQRILASGADMLKPGEKDDSKADEWPRWDEYCRARGGR